MKLPGSILQVFPSIIKESEGRLCIDVDWLDALQLYLENFEKVIFVCPVSKDIPDSGLIRCKPIDELPTWASDLEIVPLPLAYKINEFLRFYNKTQEILRHQIRKAQYLEFSPSGLVGDWAGVACIEAIKMNRPYVISGDVVYAERMRLGLRSKPLWKQYIQELTSVNFFNIYYKYILKNAEMGLFQGQDTYNEYCYLPKKSHQIYHVTMTPEEHINASQLDSNLDEIMQGDCLKILYAGRATPIKGSLDWVYAINAAIKGGVNLEATWIGDGSLLPEMQSLIKKLDIEKHVKLAGLISDRKILIEALKESDIFLFCHKTRESPRCLIEALGTGCALVGYEGEYVKSLISQHGGGIFVPVGEWNELAQLLIRLNSDRAQLCNLIQDSYKSGLLYERDAAYMHRINIVKEWALFHA